MATSTLYVQIANIIDLLDDQEKKNNLYTAHVRANGQIEHGYTIPTLQQEKHLPTVQVAE